METAKKGDRVQFELNNGINYGVVKKGGKGEVRVVLDGGKRVFDCHISFLTLSDKPLAKDSPNFMDKYSVKNFKSHGVRRDGKAFTCTICMAGKAFATVEQNGNGGANSYYPTKIPEEGYRTMLANFKADAKRWAELFGGSLIEADDSWVEWWVNFRPYGCTAAMYLKPNEK